LRVLAEGEFYRVGGQTPIRVDVRVIAATHQNLQDRVTRGLFREDLYHRLNVIRIELPPLRARSEDIPDLLAHYLTVAAHELGVEPKSLSKEGEARLATYNWPGNVRELVNLCRRLSVLAPGTEISVEDLPPELGAAATEGSVEADWAKALRPGSMAASIAARSERTKAVLRILRSPMSVIRISLANMSASRPKIRAMMVERPRPSLSS